MEKPSVPERKENSSKEQPAAMGKKPHATNEATPTESHNLPRSTPSRAEGREPAGPVPETDSKGSGTEEEESPGGFYENMKPMLLIGGVVIAALAVILGVAFLARKK
ncbi:cell cycle exit and neuronal differentiation protein 1 [Microcaecilia unicolor]|uniref:Cell cycle exit and neuronal differentiation protein 1 n=1 Tax=Microcaecilia unicolor TaxID=1415580 RepID=A0A6P7XZL1_9AMPH|nr:cell cycle exit and neuronal differentiation protein 1 [Microcaecilia unicolor]